MLYAPPTYHMMGQELKDALNGCGTGGWKCYLVPDTLLGLCITPACNIHDFMYITGETIEHKEEADRVFLNNMLRLIEDCNSLWFISRMRRNRAWVYYQAVHKFGGPAFWADKNPPATMGALCQNPVHTKYAADMTV
jgi:hypothetical protein